MRDYISLRQTFDKVALLYNEARPCYPDELFSTLISITGLTSNAEVLEIGPGTGQATKPLAIGGYNITCIELGSALSKVAQHELSDYPNVEILTGAFESMKLPNGTFDLVLAATSFHWIKPEVKYIKSHQILKQNGYLAIIHTNHVSDEKGDFLFEISKPIYDRYNFSDKNQNQSLPKTLDIFPIEIDKNLFRLIHFQLFPVMIIYTAKEYINLLNTYSNHLAAKQQVRDDFFKEIEALINERFNGSIEKHFVMSLTIAQKV
jgi:SAM-dependent methyltransferase